MGKMKGKEPKKKNKDSLYLFVLFGKFYITYDDYITLKLFQLIQTWFMCN